MRLRRFWMLILIFGLGIAAIGLLLIRSAQQPSYQGKTVRQWFRQYAFPHNFADKDEALAALQAMRDDSTRYLAGLYLNGRPFGTFRKIGFKLMSWFPFISRKNARYSDDSEAFELAVRDGLSELNPSTQSMLPLLKAQLSQPKDKRYLRALSLLGYSASGTDQAIPFLAQAWTSTNFLTRVIAISSLWQLREQAHGAESTLIQAMREPKIRLRAIQALGNIGLKANVAQSALEPFLSNPDVRVRIETAVALYKINPTNQHFDSIYATAKATNNGGWRDRAFVVLGEIGPPAAPAVDILLARLKQLATEEYEEFYDARAWQCVVKAIRQIAPTNPEPIRIIRDRIQNGKKQDRFNLALLLVRHYPEEPQGIAILADIARQNPAPAQRIFALQELRLAGTAAKAAIPTLKAMEHDPDPGVRKAAAMAIQAIGKNYENRNVK